MNRLLSVIIVAGGLGIVGGEIGSMLHYRHDAADIRAADSLTSRVLGVRMAYLCQQGNVAPRGHRCDYSRLDMENGASCCEPSPFIRHAIGSSASYAKPATLRELVATSFSVPVELIAGVSAIILGASSYASRREQTSEEKISPAVPVQ